MNERHPSCGLNRRGLCLLPCLLRVCLQIRFFVLDEADRLLDSEDVIMKLFKRLPKGGAGLARLQVMKTTDCGATLDCSRAVVCGSAASHGLFACSQTPHTVPRDSRADRRAVLTVDEAVTRVRVGVLWGSVENLLLLLLLLLLPRC